MNDPLITADPAVIPTTTTAPVETGTNDPLITTDPAVMLGKPVIVGTRITVELILEKLAAGETIDDLLLDYPSLTRPAVLAALQFALQVLRNDVVYPIQGRVA